MPDTKNVRGEAVPKHLLTSGQVEFQKKFGQLKDIRKLLEMKTLGLKNQFKNIQEMWDMLGQSFNMLKQPKENMRELPGMNFMDEDQGEQQGGQQGGQASPMQY